MRIDVLILVSIYLVILIASGCQTSAPQPPTDPPRLTGEPVVTEEQDPHSPQHVQYGHAHLQLPATFVVTVDESGLRATDAETQSPCHATTVELTNFLTHINGDTVEESDGPCQTRRSIKTLKLPHPIPTRARLICESPAAPQELGAQSTCDEIVDSFVLTDDSNAETLTGLASAQIRDRITPDLSNEPGTQEIFIPGEGFWRPVIYADTIDLGLTSDAVLIGTDRTANGTFLELWFQNSDGDYLKNELDYIDSTLWAEDLSGESTVPPDLFALIRDEYDGQPSQRCLRFSFDAGFYRKSSDACPDNEARGHIIFSH